MVMLAVRPLEGYTTMGRETFLAKVVWENGWPVVNPGVGILTEQVEIELPEWNPAGDAVFDGRGNCVPGSSRTYEFGRMERLGDEFLFLRNPGEGMYALGQEGLELSFRHVTLKEKDSPSYVAVRQQHHLFEASAVLKTDTLEKGRRAGMALMQSDEYHLRVELCRHDGEALQAEVILCRKGQDTVESRVALESGALSLTWKEPGVILRVEGLKASVELLADDGVSKSVLCGDLDIRELSTESAGGFVGCTVGMYAVAEDGCGEGRVCFRRFSYRAL